MSAHATKSSSLSHSPVLPQPLHRAGTNDATAGSHGQSSRPVKGTRPVAGSGPAASPEIEKKAAKELEPHWAAAIEAATD